MDTSGIKTGVCKVPKMVKKGVDTVDGYVEKVVDFPKGLSNHVPVTRGTAVHGVVNTARTMKHQIRNAANRVRPCHP